MNTATTRLEEVIKLLGWQGGTIHQVNEECIKLLDLPRYTDINEMELFQFELLKACLKLKD